MKFITLQEMNEAIRKNLWKIPRDIDFCLGIPRSGILAASIICEYLNCPLVDVDSFCEGAKPTGGARLRYWKPKHPTGKKKVLVVDDTIWNGRSKNEAKKKLSKFSSDFEFVYLVVFLEGPGEKSIDIWLEDVRKYTNNFRDNVIYEWNIIHHNENTMAGSMWDIDGVMCVNPPDERNENEYQSYIREATPLFIPTAPIGGICSYRLRKNADTTIEWLNRQDIRYKNLYLFPADSWEERNASGVNPCVFKARCYAESKWANLFIESEDLQAMEIARLAGKPVYCVETNRLY